MLEIKKNILYICHVFLMRVNQPNTDINVFLPVLFVCSFVLLIYVLYNLFQIGILLKKKKARNETLPITDAITIVNSKIYSCFQNVSLIEQ